jgi:hypothetical protein
MRFFPKEYFSERSISAQALSEYEQMQNPYLPQKNWGQPLTDFYSLHSLFSKQETQYFPFFDNRPFSMPFSLTSPFGRGGMPFRFPF